MAVEITLLYFAAVRTALPGEPASQVIRLPPLPSSPPDIPAGNNAPPPPPPPPGGWSLAHLRTYLVEHVHAGNDEFARVLVRCGWSVNEEMVDEEEEARVVLRGGEVVCPIPPVSGG